MASTRKHFLNIFLIFVCVSPNFIFLRPDIWKEDIIYLFVYYFFFFLAYFIFSNIKNSSYICAVFFAFIVFIGFDKNLRLWLFFENITTLLFFKNNLLSYILSFIFFIISTYFISKYINNRDNDLKKGALISVLILSIFNISSEYYLDARHKNLEKKINYQTTDNEKNIIIILDGVVGPGGIEKKFDKNIGAKKSTYELYEKYGFKIYSNAYSIYYETLESVSSLLNFDYLVKKDARSNTLNYLTRSILDKNSTYHLNQNKFFDVNKENIFATKNRIFNFCNEIVSECYSLNHNDVGKKKYVTRLESIISEMRNERSIFYQYLFRVALLNSNFNKEDSHITNKVFFEKDLYNFEKIISNSNFKTYVTFLMYPHSPIMLEKSNKNCYFQELNKISYSKDSRADILRGHYAEIYCGNLIIDNFLKRLKENNNFEKLNILIVSDTGYKIDKYDLPNLVNGLENYNKKYLNDAHKVLFAIKKGNSSFEVDNTLKSSQELFSKYFGKLHKKNYSNEAIIYDIQKKIFFDGLKHGLDNAQ